jgi:hypothetical protein
MRKIAGHTILDHKRTEEFMGELQIPLTIQFTEK